MKTGKMKVALSVLLVALIAWTFNSCSKSDSAAPPDKTALKAEITVAQNLLSSTTEGTANGQYVRGSQAILQTAIDNAQAVVDNASSTKDQITSATAQLTAAVSTYEASAIVPIDPSNLVGQWTFDELTTASAGTAVMDYSGNSFNGTLKAGHSFWSTSDGFLAACGFSPPASYPATPVNVPTITTDRYGNQHALHFMAGANVEIPYNTLLNPQAITVSLWAKEDTIIQSGSYQWINNQYMIALSRWNGWKFNMQNSPRAFFTVNNTTGYDNQDNNQTLTGITKNWIHYAVTFTSGTMTFYVNGVQSAIWTTGSEVGTMVLLNGAAGTATAQQNLTIGQDLPTSAYTTDDTTPNYLNWGGFYTGAMDDVRIYKTALTAQQVLAIYNQEKP